MSVILPVILILGTGLGVITFFIIKSIIAPRIVSNLEDLIKQGKYSAATKSAKQILAKEPRNARAHYLLGKVYQGDNKPELALMEFKKVNELGDFSHGVKESEFRESIASLYRQFNQPEEALKEYILLSRLEPDNPEIFFNIGQLFEDRDRRDKAAQFYQKTIQLDERHSRAHFQLGYMAFRGKKLVEAKSEFDQAIRFDPDNYWAYFYIGKILKSNGDYVGALVAFEKAQRDPELKVRSLVERGHCYIQSNNLEKAVVELERAIKLTENESSGETLFARYYLGFCYEKGREIDKAVEQWEKIYAKKPAFQDVAEKLSQYQDLRRDDLMKEYLTASHDDFYEICKAISQTLNLNVRDIEDIRNGCQIIAVESETKWRGAKKIPKLMWFLRVPEMISESTVRSMYEAMKQLNVGRGIIISSSNFSKKARDFAETRPFNLIGQEKLQAVLKKINL